MSYPCSSILEVMGLLSGVGAWFCLLATTLMPSWLTFSNEITSASENRVVGLWKSCVVDDLAGTECYPLNRPLYLSYNLRMARIYMCISDALGLLSILIAVPGLRLMKRYVGSQGRKVRCSLKITAGVLCLIAAAFGLYPVSNLAHATILEFNDVAIPDAVTRWELGNALYVGWVAGFLLVVSAMLFFTSCCSLKEKEMLLKLLSRKKN
ncbi:putative claudin-24 [Tachysurus ichikawai]